MGRAKTGSARREKASKRQTSWEGRGSCQPPQPNVYSGLKGDWSSAMLPVSLMLNAS